MILVVDHDPERRLKMQYRIYAKFALNTCGAATDEVEDTLGRYPVAALFLPYAEELPDLIEFCRSFKLRHPNIPLIATVPKGTPEEELDALYRVTDNIPLRPLFLIRQIEIVCEMIRLYTRRDRLEQTAAGVRLSIYTFTIFFCGRMTTYCPSALSILHHLATHAPEPVSVEELARCTGNPCDRRETGGRIRQRISAINQQATRELGRPLIANIRAKGYVIDPYAVK